MAVNYCSICFITLTPGGPFQRRRSRTTLPDNREERKREARRSRQQRLRGRQRHLRQRRQALLDPRSRPPVGRHQRSWPPEPLPLHRLCLQVYFLLESGMVEIKILVLVIPFMLPFSSGLIFSSLFMSWSIPVYFYLLKVKMGKTTRV